MEEYRRRQHERWLQQRQTSQRRTPPQQPTATQSFQPPPSQHPTPSVDSSRQRQIDEDEELARRLQAQYLMEAETFHPSTEDEVLASPLEDSEQVEEFEQPFEPPQHPQSSHHQQQRFMSYPSGPIPDPFSFPVPSEMMHPRSRGRGRSPFGSFNSLFSMFDRMFQPSFQRMQEEPDQVSEMPPEMQMMFGFPGFPGRVMRPRGPGGLYEMLSQLQPVERPADPNVVSQLPVIDHKPGTLPEDEHRCPICLGDFETGEKVIVLPCNHRLHQKECSEELFKHYSQCPMCRTELPRGER
ncbi:hypothetical protein P9112_014649 [Eukaryota sp. TZLM1-RC]